MASERTSRAAKTRARDWAPAFLAAFEKTMLVSEAAKTAAVGRRTVYDRRVSDEEFRRAWDEIVERSVEIMERAAFERATVGTRKPVFQGGVEVGAVREFSDVLLMFLLKARKPETYRERHEVRHSGAVEHRHRLNLAKLTDEQLAALEAIQPDAGSADAE